MNRRVSKSRFFKSTLRDEKSFPYKDVLTGTLSATAIIISLTGTWFQFFRSTAHLKMAIADIYVDLEDKKPNADVQILNDTYNITFLNNGNKPIVLKTMTRTIQKLPKNDLETLIKITDNLRKVLSPNNILTPKMMEDTEKSMLTALPDCNKVFYEKGETYWEKYTHDDKSQQQGPVVVKPDEFYIMNKLQFFPDFVEEKSLGEDEKELDLLICLKVEYIKPDGSAGSRALPSTIVRIGRSDERKQLFKFGTVIDFFSLRDIDQ